jgi:hypothetical protein
LPDEGMKLSGATKHKEKAPRLKTCRTRHAMRSAHGNSGWSRRHPSVARRITRPSRRPRQKKGGGAAKRAGLDRRHRRARVTASAPGGMQPRVSPGGINGSTSPRLHLHQIYNADDHACLNAWRQPRVGRRLHPTIGRSASRGSAPLPRRAGTHERHTRAATATRVFTGG